MTKARCNNNCRRTVCVCKLPIFALDHIELKCCSNSLYHLICIMDQSKCFNCQKEFNPQIIKAIKKAESNLLENYQKKHSTRNKTIAFRNHIKKKVYEIMLNRIRERIASRN